MASGAFRYAEVDTVLKGSGSPSSTDTTPVGYSAPAIPSGWQNPAAYFERQKFTDGVLAMPDGEKVRFWGFEDPRVAGVAKSLPSPTIRVREGLPVHIKLDGGEGDCHIYQWQPKGAGTWLYQPHQGSLKQFEMGLFGLLIVDPEPDEETGKPCAYRGGPAYDVERCWVFDDVDPDWHEAEVANTKATGQAFAPKYFLVNGVPNVQTQDSDAVAITARAGDKVLVRLLNASFSLVSTRIERLRGDIISVDGKALVTPERPWGRWSAVNSGQRVYMATGARHDLLIDLGSQPEAVKAGDEFLVTFEFLDFARRQVRNADAPSPLYVGRALTRIRVV